MSNPTTSVTEGDLRAFKYLQALLKSSDANGKIFVGPTPPGDPANPPQGVTFTACIIDTRTNALSPISYEPHTGATRKKALLKVIHGVEKEMSQIIYGASEELLESEGGVEEEQDRRKTGDKRKRMSREQAERDETQKRTKRAAVLDAQGAAGASAIARGKRPIPGGEESRSAGHGMGDVNLADFENEDEDDGGELREIHTQAHRGGKMHREPRALSAGLHIDGMDLGSDPRGSFGPSKPKNARQAISRKEKRAASDADDRQGRGTSAMVTHQGKSGAGTTTRRQKASAAEQDSDEEVKFLKEQRAEPARAKSAAELKKQSRRASRG